MKNSLKNISFLVFFSTLFFTITTAQKLGKVNFVNSNATQVGTVTGEVILDGILSEPFWKNASPATDFVLKFPLAGELAKNQTSVKMMQDGINLYIGISCQDPDEEKTLQLTGIRDFNPSENDAVSILFDPYSDGTNGFMFSVTPLGVQQEGILFEGSTVDNSWDRPWNSVVSRKGNGWEAEWMIPLTSLRFPSGKSQWRVNFLRYDLESNEVSSWAPVPLSFDENSLAFTGSMNWASAPGWEKPTFALNSGVSSNSNSYSTFPGAFVVGPGISAKSNLNSSITLDGSLNFFGVNEYNFKRYSNEENPDLFERKSFPFLFFGNSFGFPGLGSTAEVKLTGKLNDNLRLGVVSSQWMGGLFDKFDFRKNLTSATLQQKVFTRSAVTGILTNQVSSDSNGIDWKGSKQTLGLSFAQRSANDRWISQIDAAKIFGGDSAGVKAAVNFKLRYQTAKWGFIFHDNFRSPEFNPNTDGNGNSNFSNYTLIGANHFYYPVNRKLFRHGWQVEAVLSLERSSTQSRINTLNRLYYMLDWKNRSYLHFASTLNPFQPFSNSPFPFYISNGLSYGTDFRKKFSMENYLGFSAGEQLASLYISVKPRLRLNNKGYLEFPVFFTTDERFGKTTNLGSVVIQLNYALRNNLFLTSGLGGSIFPDFYRNSAFGSNLYCNLQWRFRPLSDINVGLRSSFSSDYLFNKFSYWPQISMNWWIGNLRS